MKHTVLIAPDLELSGRHVISVGIATLDERGRHTLRTFLMHGIHPPSDRHGSLLSSQGVLREPHGPVHYNSFTKAKWEGFWKHHPRVLASQIRWSEDTPRRTNDDEWRDIRLHVDNITRLAMARGARVRVVSDNASVDVGIVNEHLKRVFQSDGDGDVTLDHLPLGPGPDRVHSFVVDTRGPRWLRRLGILRYQPYSVPGITITKHFAAHDALLAACEYMGFVRFYPMVEK